MKTGKTPSAQTGKTASSSTQGFAHHPDTDELVRNRWLLFEAWRVGIECTLSAPFGLLPAGWAQ